MGCPQGLLSGHETLKAGPTLGSAALPPCPQEITRNADSRVPLPVILMGPGDNQCETLQRAVRPGDTETSQ
jgi:hypothetical protein